MILIIGGAGQGKLDYVLRKTGYTPDQVAHTPEEAKTKPVFDGLEQWPHLDEEELLTANPWCRWTGTSGPGGRMWGGCAAAWPVGRSGWSASSAACP